MNKLALTFLMATAALAIATISTPSGQAAAGDHSKIQAVACCDDPPPPCYPEFPPCDDDDKGDPPGGGQGLKVVRQ